MVAVFVVSYYSINKSSNETEAAQAAIPPVISNVKPSEITNLAKKLQMLNLKIYLIAIKTKELHGKVEYLMLKNVHFLIVILYTSHLKQTIMVPLLHKLIWVQMSHLH